RQDAVRERIAPRVEVDVVRSRHEVRDLAEPGLYDVSTPLTKESIKDSVASPQHGLAVYLKRKTDSRHEVMLRSFIQTIPIGAYAGEEQAAADEYVGSRRFEQGIVYRRVPGSNRRLDRLNVAKIKT